MKRAVIKWYFDKLIAALKQADISWEQHPKFKVKGKWECCDGYCVKQVDKPKKWKIVLRYRPATSNHLYVLIHEAIHAAFPDWPEIECWGEPVDRFAKQLLYEFSTNQLDELQSYLPGR